MRKNFLNYPVETAEDLFGENEALAKTLRAAVGGGSPRILIVADYNVVTHNEGLGARIGRYVKDHSLELAGTPVVMGGGEKVKADGLQSFRHVLSAMAESKLGGGDMVLTLGGGTILDIAGFAAGQYLGGVKIVRVPTTPAAMFEAAFAEYAAVDYLEVKDALRVPSVPAAVMISPGFASTVLPGVWRAGFGEAVRQAAVHDPRALPKLEAVARSYADRQPQALEEALGIVRAIREKKGPTDFALDLAGRLEAMSGWKLPHGYAVAIALTAELSVGVGNGTFPEKTARLAASILRTAGALDGLDHSRTLLERAGSDLYTGATDLLK